MSQFMILVTNIRYDYTFFSSKLKQGGIYLCMIFSLVLFTKDI